MDPINRTTPITRGHVLAFCALATIFIVGTNAAARQARGATAAQPTPPAPTITLVTRPSPLAAGDTTFTVTVKGPDGRPVTGADVTVELVMAAMPAMKMPEMRNKIALKPPLDAKVAATGAYTGKGLVMMPGTWAATVSVKVNGKDFAEKKLTLTAK